MAIANNPTTIGDLIKAHLDQAEDPSVKEMMEVTLAVWEPISECGKVIRETDEGRVVTGMAVASSQVDHHKNQVMKACQKQHEEEIVSQGIGAGCRQCPNFKTTHNTRYDNQARVTIEHRSKCGDVGSMCPEGVRGEQQNLDTFMEQVEEIKLHMPPEPAAPPKPDRGTQWGSW